MEPGLATNLLVLKDDDLELLIRLLYLPCGEMTNMH